MKIVYYVLGYLAYLGDPLTSVLAPLAGLTSFGLITPLRMDIRGDDITEHYRLFGMDVFKLPLLKPMKLWSTHPSLFLIYTLFEIAKPEQ